MGRCTKVVFVAAAILLITSPILAREEMLDREITKGIGTIEGIHGTTLKSMRTWQKGCEEQFQFTRPPGIDILLKEYGNRLDLLERELKKLKEEMVDENRASLLKEDSFKVAVVTKLAEHAGEALFALLKAGCAIEAQGR